MRYRLAVLSLIVAALVAVDTQPTKSFTPEQAAAGGAAYAQNCATCHGANLRQLPDAQLTGREFVAKWGNRSVSELVAQLRTMPPDNPGGLPQQTYEAIAAYLLQSNGGAADGRPLAANSTTRISDALAGRGAAAPPAAAASGRGAAPAAGPSATARTGVTVAGTVSDFVPVTDEMLQESVAGRLADAAARLRRDELQPADADHG